MRFENGTTIFPKGVDSPNKKNTVTNEGLPDSVKGDIQSSDDGEPEAKKAKMVRHYFVCWNVTLFIEILHRFVNTNIYYSENE